MVVHMFGGVLLGDPAGSTGSSTAQVRGWIDQLAQQSTPADDAVRIDEIESLERLKSAAAARQAQLSAAFAASHRAAQRAAGARSEQISRGISAQLALARHDSPHAGNRHLGLAEALIHEMPQTLAALRRGDTSEWRSTVMARESACLSREHRAAVDADLGPRLAGMGNKRVEREARKLAYQLDPGAAIRRVRGAEDDRRVTIRPAPEVMARLTGFVPAKQGVAAYAALRAYADRLTAQGDTRSRTQIMADAFVQRLTGETTAESGDAEVLLIINEHTLGAAPTQHPPGSAAPAGAAATQHPPEPAEDTADEPAELHDYGPVPAWWARHLVRESTGRIWLRRAFTNNGRLITLESTRRLFPEGLRRALIVRDQLCRTPWCGAPIRHADHIQAHSTGGATNLDNGQGLCAACNYTKQTDGWQATTVTEAHIHTVKTTTPTGHTYQSQAPPLPGTKRKTSPGHGPDPPTDLADTG